MLVLLFNFLKGKKMFKLNRAAAIETAKVILFSIVVAIATALVVNFVSMEFIMIGFLIAAFGFLIKMIYDNNVDRQQSSKSSNEE
jgi:MFS superfamily sulfate permease-like transporter